MQKGISLGTAHALFTAKKNMTPQPLCVGIVAEITESGLISGTIAPYSALNIYELECSWGDLITHSAGAFSVTAPGTPNQNIKHWIRVRATLEPLTASSWKYYEVKINDTLISGNGLIYENDLLADFVDQLDGSFKSSSTVLESEFNAPIPFIVADREISLDITSTANNIATLSEVLEGDTLCLIDSGGTTHKNVLGAITGGFTTEYDSVTDGNSQSYYNSNYLTMNETFWNRFSTTYYPIISTSKKMNSGSITFGLANGSGGTMAGNIKLIDTSGELDTITVNTSVPYFLNVPGYWVYYTLTIPDGIVGGSGYDKIEINHPNTGNNLNGGHLVNCQSVNLGFTVGSLFVADISAFNFNETPLKAFKPLSFFSKVDGGNFIEHPLLSITDNNGLDQFNFAQANIPGVTLESKVITKDFADISKIEIDLGA